MPFTPVFFFYTMDLTELAALLLESEHKACPLGRKNKPSHALQLAAEYLTFTLFVLEGFL